MSGSSVFLFFFVHVGHHVQQVVGTVELLFSLDIGNSNPEDLNKES